MSRRSLTIADVAKRAGVAPMTVSRAINGSGYVAEETRNRVMRAIEESNYRPNRIASSLRSQKTNLVGVLLSDIADPFSAELTGVLEEMLAPGGYSFVISTTHGTEERAQAALGAFDDHRVDGVLIAADQTKAGSEALAVFAERGLPIVLVGRGWPEIKTADRVTADEFAGAFEATRHLLKLGHKRIAFLGASVGDRLPRDFPRYRGYLSAMKESGWKVPAEYSNPDLPASPNQSDGYQGLVRLMTLEKQPTALFAQNDYIAIGALRAAYDLGMRVPGDLAVVGFGNVPISAYTTPPLTTVDPAMTEQARQAADFLLERLGGQSLESREVLMDCRLVLRDSTVAKIR